MGGQAAGGRAVHAGSGSVRRLLGFLRARLYAAEQTGVLSRSHADVFKALHESRSLPAQNVTPDELATFYSSYGVQPAQFVDALRSQAVEDKVKNARAFAMRVQVPGTPALIVNGKYLVKGRTFDDTLRITSALVAAERAAARK